uniref:SET domain-containing protein n=1 Tax=Lotharella oceanica TaxID=641309 RepID=A0A7S2TLR0_9EUKA
MDKKTALKINEIQRLFKNIIGDNVIHRSVQSTFSQKMEGCACDDGKCQKGRCGCFFAFGYRQCNSRCRCVAATCKNRSLLSGSPYVQRNALEIFHTEGKSWGLRTCVPISSGSFVVEYVGEYISIQEYTKRNKKGTALNYQLMVREHFPKHNKILRHVIDATEIGNCARFINHACAPNLEVRPLRVDTMLPRFALYAKRDIQKGEELCISYGNPPPKAYQAYAQKCHCGSEECLGYLPYDPDAGGQSDTMTVA